MARKVRPTIPVLPVLGNLALIRARERAAPPRMAEIQARLLRSLVRHAHARVPYYRRVLDPAAVAALRDAADLAALPVLDRAALNAVPAAEMLARGFGPDTTRAASTSGSTGVPVTLHYSERDLGHLRASYLHDLLMSGLRPLDRIGYFRVGSFRRHRLERFGLARNVHVNTSLPVAEQADRFLAGRPTFVAGFPYAIAALVGELERRGVRYPHAHTVVFGGETATPDARAHVLRYFGATGHEMYASVEAYTIARSCPRGALHLRSAEVVVEVEHDDGTVSVADGEGEILVTRLRAEAMPLLRYRLGDRVVVTPDDCGCGVLRTPIVRRVQGRPDDRVRARDGSLVHADFLAYPALSVPGIRALQIVQLRPGAVEIVVVPAPDAGPGLPETVRRAVLPAAAGFDVTVRAAEAIAPERNGKIRLVRRR
ncbi:capsular polysaccharide biosynthesis protein [Sphaerisporangium rufum]|uniref:Capsular polysaccharide biosynthesis protein n=1 Tax=Sphaerisporangium rufum TaxID=1381558 RepID=A0A919UYW9_9ACTN|nr:phenylacetate--CoA ligase family protein [Sphaerisporangium rufum]GII78476.1 capsular polysaccharide biosynthesis protein [Sphaerisporangium rufum]